MKNSADRKERERYAVRTGGPTGKGKGKRLSSSMSRLGKPTFSSWENPEAEQEEEEGEKLLEAYLLLFISLPSGIRICLLRRPPAGG